MQLIWLSDLHLDFLSMSHKQRFYLELSRLDADGVLLTGDISTADELSMELPLLARSLPFPVYFVLGNHDFYHGSFTSVQKVVDRIVGPQLIQLDRHPPIRLSEKTMLVGHQGWADGRAGAGVQSTVRLNDHELIDDLRDLPAKKLFQKLEMLGEQSVRELRPCLQEALSQVDNVLIATHVPPFVEASLYMNQPSNPGFAPHFVNHSLGEMLLEEAAQNPSKKLTVYCGHSHHEAFFQAAPNLRVCVTSAIYREPKYELIAFNILN